MSEPGENQDSPVEAGRDEPESDGPWRNVPQPTAEELVTPKTPVTAPQMPMAIKVGGLALVAILLLMAAWLGVTLGGAGGEPKPTPTPTVDETLWPLEAPTTQGNFVVGDVTSTPLDTSSDRDIVTAKYSDGTDKLVLLLSRPEEDLGEYLENLRVEDTEPVEDATCGTSVDDEVPVCARVVDQTAIAVAGLTGQDSTQLASLVDSFYSELQ